MFILAVALQIHASCFRDLKSQDQAPVIHASTEADRPLRQDRSLHNVYETQRN